MTSKLPFLSRWSQRKMQACSVNQDGQNKKQPDDSNDLVAGSGDVRSQQMTGNSIAGIALQEIFRQSEFAKPDGLNEYDEDYRFFTPRGGLITQEMRRAWDRFDETMLADNQHDADDTADDEYRLDRDQG